MEHLKTTVEQLFQFDRHLLGPGYDAALEYINMLIPLDITAIPSGKEFGTWTVPEEWVVKEAWVKYKGEKIIDYHKNPLSLVDYSLPFKGMVTKEELLKHLHWSDKRRDATPYVFKFYERDWGFCVPKTTVQRLNSEADVIEEKVVNGKILITEEHKEDWVEALEEGEYEVFIDTEFKPGWMKLGVHTIPGELDKEILIFAHLDHPYQANDNLSGVACLLDLAKRLKTKYTVKLVFCPETIGSIAYAHSFNLEKVEFVIAVDICGNNNSILLQKAFDTEARINRVAHCALQNAGKTFRKGKFRTMIGSDETAFNDPLIGIPGILLTTWPYDEYHTSEDTPDKLDYEKIKETSDLIMKIIEIYEKDYIPVREFKGPLMRSRYGIQSPDKTVNLNYDYIFWAIDGKKWLSEIAADFEHEFDTLYENFSKVELDRQIRRFDVSEGKVKKTRRKKS